ncbi:MAG: hypothetical protein ABEJ06_05840 [Haloarculaceae archaeon]
MTDNASGDRVPSARFVSVLDRAARWWRRLDRGWQASLLGLVVVCAAVAL